MSTNHDPQDQRSKIEHAAKAFEVGMLITQTPDGFRARPMSLASTPGHLDELLFATSKSAAVADEIRRAGHAAFALQSSSAYLNLDGPATVFHDEALAQKLWKPAWRVWFPDGPTSPDLMLIRITPTSAELWDASMTASMRYLFERARAIISGHDDPQVGGREMHTRVNL